MGVEEPELRVIDVDGLHEASEESDVGRIGSL